MPVYSVNVFATADVQADSPEAARAVLRALADSYGSVNLSVYRTTANAQRQPSDPRGSVFVLATIRPDADLTFKSQD